MTRTYELGFIVEPRQNDDEVQAITDRFTGMLEDAGSKITYVDQWGKRKLAYPIRKFQEGKYVFVYVTSEEAAPPWPDIERLMMQDEKILRFLVVRTDEDIKRANRKGKVKPQVPGAEEEAKSEETAEAKSEETAEAKAEETAEAKSEETAEAKSEETAEAKPEETAEAKSEETAEAEPEEAAEAKSEDTEAAPESTEPAEGETKEGDD